MCRLAQDTVSDIMNRGRIFEVGGAVRDLYLNPDLPIKDRDYLVTGIPYEELSAILRRQPSSTSQKCGSFASFA